MTTPTPEYLRRRARKLYLKQRDARGWVRAKTLDGKPCKIPGPYVPTPENEERGQEILMLRRWAAELEAEQSKERWR